MSDTVTFSIDGRQVKVERGTTVAAAIADLDVGRFRRSVTGEGRYPLCGMGICFECRVTIDGETFHRSCVTPARDGMEVSTDA